MPTTPIKMMNPMMPNMMPKPGSTAMDKGHPGRKMMGKSMMSKGMMKKGMKSKKGKVGGY